MMSVPKEGDFISLDNWGYSKPMQVPVFEYDDIKKKNRYDPYSFKTKQEENYEIVDNPAECGL